MRKLVMPFAVPLLCLVLAGLLGGCVSVSFNGVYRGADAVEGFGERVELEFDAPAYHSVDIRTNLMVIYSSEYSKTVRVELYENQAQHLDVSVKDGVLLVQSERNLDRGTGKPIYLYLANPHLEEMHMSGGVMFHNADTIRREQFTLEVRGGGSIDLDFEVETLRLDLSGAGNFHLTGTATDLELTMSGVGNVEAQQLVVQHAVVALSGVSNIEIHCTESLDASVTGTGSLQYWGNPERVRESIGGLGSISAME